MNEVEWIKLNVNMFDNRKIKHIRKLPEGNNIVLIWVMLLTLAGRCNAGGLIFITENIPYNTKMLADELDFEENTVKLAIEALKDFDMISTDGFLSIVGWEEHQNAPALNAIREYNRIAKQKSREKQKQKQLAALVNDRSMTCQEEVKTDVNENSNSLSYSEDSLSEDLSSSEESIGGAGGKGEGDDDLVPRKKNDDIVAQAKTVIDVWNSESCLPEIKRCSPSSERGKMLIARIKEYGVDDVIEAVHLAGNSKFLLDAAWFDFSWFVKPNNFIKVLEGKYNRQSSLVEEFTGNMFFDNAKEMVRNERFGS